MTKNNMQLSILVFVMLIPLSLPGSAQASMIEAHRLMKTSNYEEAIGVYQKIVAGGQEGISLFYNLGIAYHETGKLPESILYFEKALKLSPKDKDILHNLQIANSKIDQDIIPVETFFLLRWWESAYQALQPDVFAVLSVVFGSIFLFGLYIRMFLRQKRICFFAKWLMPLSFIIAAFLGTAGWNGYRDLHYDHTGILMTDITGRESPDNGSPDIYQLKAGSKVKLMETKKEWHKLQLINKDTCWVKNIQWERI